VYGRFDLVYDGTQAPKLLEYNADTPTALFEASVAQWYWLQDHDAGKDQFNAIHERLLDRWQEIGARLPRGETVYFACLQDNVEDYVTTEYLRDTAQQTGLLTGAIDIEAIGYESQEGVFVDTGNRAIGTLFKLYPWEWLMHDDFAPHLLAQPWRMLEPPWKMLLSNKGILPILWELFPDHPNLLPAYFEPGPLGTSYVQKPLLSREGANITIRQRDGVLASPGGYGQEGWIYQAHCPLPAYDGNHAVIGSWIIGEASAGIGIREDDGPITRNTSRFVPHYFDQEASC
jgi:glutathionylspermidine synthase